MVRSLINRLVEKWPEGGIAIHGTTYSNVASIKRFGIVKGQPYVCPFPHKLAFSNYSPEEILERSIGSALFAGGHATRRTRVAETLATLDSGGVPKFDERNLPAIVILKGKQPGEFSMGYDHNHFQEKGFYQRKYRSFGKSPQKVAADRVAGIVRIKPEEYIELIRKAKGDVLQARKLIKSSLAMKTLVAIRKLVERGEK